MLRQRGVRRIDSDLRHRRSVFVFAQLLLQSFKVDRVLKLKQVFALADEDAPQVRVSDHEVVDARLVLLVHFAHHLVEMLLESDQFHFRLRQGALRVGQVFGRDLVLDLWWLEGS